MKKINVVKNDESIVEKILKERIKENEKLFTEKEINNIKNNPNIFSKIYLLGMLDRIWQLFWQLFVWKSETKKINETKNEKNKNRHKY